MGYLWIVLLGLALVWWVGYRRRLGRELGGGAARLTDEHIRRIEASGLVEIEDLPDDEPLDLEEIERAENEFWEESWDEPESW